jgi:hypothetical protein
MSKISIRYNTKAKENDTLHWRVVIDGIETLASDVEVNTRLWTTKDWIEEVGWKWHITCESTDIQWDENHKCIIN